MMLRVEQYLSHRRGLGSPLRTTAYMLRAFARFADEDAPGQRLTCSLATRWIDTHPRDMRVTRNNRVAALRGFARFCQALDSHTEVPPLALLSSKPKRRAPHIFSDYQVRCLMRRTQHLRASRARLRGMTMKTLIGLLACTGLRIGEALRLRFRDFDARAGLIHISRTKHSPERDLPLHSSTVRALRYYQEVRWRQYPGGEHFFVGPCGKPLTVYNARHSFACVARGLRVNGARARPRLHDLRHSFATKLIAQWSRQPAPVEHRLLLLSRYLGHRHFSDTYWYLEPDRAALQWAAASFSRYHRRTGVSR
jgi:integrase